MSLLNNFNYKVYLSNLPVLIMVIRYQSNLLVLFMGNDFNWTFFVTHFFLTKEIVERRHRQLIKIIILPKIGLFGSQASIEKKKFGCEF